MSLHEVASYQSAVTAEQLLIDVAGRIQLSASKHQQAVVHYETLCNYVDRKGSPLEDKVITCYPSGSFGIGAVVASKVKRDQHDVDVVLELDVPIDTHPSVVLDLLYRAIKGEYGSQYYSKVELNSRCVTVRYDDGVTVDLMPIVRDGTLVQRSGVLFHHKDGESYRKPVNPYGFKTHYNATVELDPAFVKAFRDRQIVLAEKALVEPMAEPVRLEEKSPRTVAVQLLKRFRDIRYRHPDRQKLRKPPSVVLAAMAIERPKAMPSVLAELLALAEHVRDRLAFAGQNASLIEVRNPAFHPDLFSDRWPSSVADQHVFAGDLAHLITKLTALARDQFSPAGAKQVLEDLFGETAADFAIGAYVQRRTADAQVGKLKFGVTGAVLTGSAAASSSRASIRPSTDLGEDQH